MKKNFIHKVKELFPVSFKDTFILTVIILISILVVNVLNILGGESMYISSIFVLMVMIVSRLTNGYLYGILASFVGVIGINYAYTYPYFEINFSISGYPITFTVTLITAIITSTMTSRIKHQEKIYIENEKEKLRSNLLRSVSHDIRTPLTSIIGVTTAILENGNILSDEEKNLLLNDVKEDAQWLIRIVENLLSITRISEDETKINKNPEAAEEVISEAIRKFKKQFPQINVSVIIPDELLLVPMDAILIEQVIINLLENAALHGKITTKIDVSLSKNKENAVFSISDNGVGIPKEMLTNVFKISSKHYDEKKADSKRNMGIGLSVCMSIINAHNGNITAKNNPSQGANFTFTLPLREEL